MAKTKKKNAPKTPVLEDWHDNRIFHPVEEVNDRYYRAGKRWQHLNPLPGGIAAFDPTRPKVDGGLGAAGLQGWKAKEMDDRKEGERWRRRIGGTLSQALDLIICHELTVADAALVIFQKVDRSTTERTRERFKCGLELVVEMALSGTSKHD